MIEIDIHITPVDDQQSLLRRVEQAAEKQGLILRSRGSLATYPGSIHWHYRKDKQPGTLELTYWPKTERLWVKVQARRRAQWMDEVIKNLKQTLEGKRSAAWSDERIG